MVYRRFLGVLYPLARTYSVLGAGRRWFASISICGITFLVIAVGVLYGPNYFPPCRSHFSATRNDKTPWEKKYHLILVYTALFGKKPWPSFPPGMLLSVGGPVETGHSFGCKITYNAERLNESRLVLFHGRDLPNRQELRRLSSKRSIDQQWIFVMQESPQYTYIDTQDYDGLFNLTASYRKDSDLYLPYGYYEKHPTVSGRQEIVKNFAEGKDRMIMIIISHCTEERIRFVLQLQKYIHVGVFGACGRSLGIVDANCQRFSYKCDQLKRRYKFYLSFENSFCQDYITEKYWNNALRDGLVPVVVGGGNYSDPSLAIPDSYIDATKFSSMRHLADYLKFLDNHDAAYNAFHAWRSEFRLGTDKIFARQLCRVASNNPKTSSVPLSIVWTKDSCTSWRKQIGHLLL